MWMSTAPAQSRRHTRYALRVLVDLTVTKENGEMVTFADKWIKLGIIMLNKINQTRAGK